VGRDDELALLQARLREVASRGKGGVAWLVGGEGSGKWRLAREFAARARRGPRPPIYLYARWNEVVESRPAGALLFLLHRWLQLPPGRVPGERERERLAALVAPDVALVLLSALHPAPDERFAGSVGAALAVWLTALSRTRPVIVFLDDLHRAGAVTLGALSDLLHALDRMRVLVMLGMREEISPQNPAALSALRGLVARLGGARIELGPLSEGAVHELVRRAFHRSVPRLRLAEVLWQRSRGNPGLIAEILHALAARDELTTSPEGGLLLSLAPDELPMPSSLQTLIAERLAHVPHELRRWLERLAVIGGRIEPSFVLATFPPTSRQEVDDLLARLVRQGWLVPAGTRYRFARPALREAVYRAMPPGRRVRLHAAAARGLAARAGPAPSPDVLFQRAFHLRSAEEHEGCLAIVLELMGRIRGRASAQRLLVLARWGLEALDRLPSAPGRDAERLLLLEVAADAADRLGARDEERELLDRLVDMDLDPDADPASAARLYLLHGRYASGTGQFGLARGFLRNAVQLAERTDQGALRSEANRRLATVQAHIGELADARVLSEHALAEAPDESHRALALLGLATVDALEDRFEDGLERVGAALHALRDLPVAPLGVLGFASLLRARLLRSAGRSGRALGAARHAVRLAERAGERRFEAEARARLGTMLLDLDRTDEAEAQLREALLCSREIEDRRGQVIAETWLGILLWEADDPTARGVVERATRAAQEIGYYRAEAVALAILARIRRAGGDVEEAVRASARAAELVRLYGAELSDRIVVLGSHALVLHTAQREAEGRTVVRDLRRHMRRENARIRDADLRRGQRAYSTQLLELVLSPDGPVYPRSRAS
jgi:tetratricopeptide (TPR) repeat protein